MTHECTKCSTNTSIPIDVNWEGFACRNCKTLFGKNPQTGAFEKKMTFKRPRYDDTLEIGTQCRLDLDDWTVIGYVQQEIIGAGDNGWRKYLLANENGEMRYLSVCDGYWILAKEEEYNPARFDYTKVYMPEGTFLLYSKERFKTISAEGFFPKNIPLGPRLSKDYILPPETILAEIDSSGTHSFRGRRISMQEMRQAFPEAKFPPQEGTDILNPRFSSMSETISILIGTAFALLLFAIWTFCSKTYVTEGTVDVESNKDSIVVTAPFELSHTRQMLNVGISAEVKNSWVSAGVNLINVETGEEQFAENEIYYYEGVEDGESWSEGSRFNEVRFCKVKAGKYVLAFNLFKPTDNSFSASFSYEVSDGGVPTSAFYVALLALAAFGLLIYFIEKYRWKYSKFTPYPSYDED